MGLEEWRKISDPVPMKSILLVEGRLDFQLTVRAALQNQYKLVVAGTAREALRIASNECFDLILLDVNLPDENGFELIGQFRQIEHLKDAPVLFLTGSSELMHKTAGFPLRAGDYVTKPFDEFELRARVQARMRTDLGGNTLSPAMHLGRFEFRHHDSKCFRRNHDGHLEDLGLDVFEYRILMIMAQNEGQVLTFSRLKEKVWGESAEVLDHTIESRVLAIRRKLDPELEEILSVGGLGFSFLSRRAG